MSDVFCLSKRQFSRRAPFLPTDTQGKPRVDDRRVISGIVHVLKSGARLAGLLNGNKGYDTDAVRRKVRANGAAPNISSKINRRWKPCFSSVLYRGRKAIQRMFNRLNDFQRIANSYDRLAKKFLAAICVGEVVICWL